MDTTCRGLLRRDGPPTGRCGTPNTPAGISHCQRRRPGAAGEVGAPMGERRGGLRIHWRAGLVTLKKVVTQSNECLGHPTDCVPEPKQGEQARVVGTETAARGSGGVRHEPGLGFGSPASDMLVVRNSQSRIAPGWGRLGIARRTVSLPYPKGPCHDPKPHAPYTTSGPGAGDCDDKSHLGFPIAAVTPYTGCVLVCKGASRPRGEAQPAWGAVVD